MSAKFYSVLSLFNVCTAFSHFHRKRLRACVSIDVRVCSVFRCVQRRSVNWREFNDPVDRDRVPCWEFTATSRDVSSTCVASTSTSTCTECSSTSINTSTQRRDVVTSTQWAGRVFPNSVVEFCKPGNDEKH